MHINTGYIKSHNNMSMYSIIIIIVNIVVSLYSAHACSHNNNYLQACRGARFACPPTAPGLNRLYTIAISPHTCEHVMLCM